MKARRGFVSNSSSSSFVAFGKRFESAQEFCEVIGEENKSKIDRALCDITDNVPCDWSTLDCYDLTTINVGQILFDDSRIEVVVDEYGSIFFGVVLNADRQSIDTYADMVNECKELVKNKLEPVTGPVFGEQTVEYS